MSLPLRRARPVALGLLLVTAVALLAHEGHAPLPSSGVQVNLVEGHLDLSLRARAAIDVQTELVEIRGVEERLLAHAVLAAPWRNRGFAVPRLAGQVTAVLAAPGQVVRANEVIAEVRSLELDALQQELLTARTELKLSEKTVADLKRSTEMGIVSGQALIAAENKLRRDQNALTVARAKWSGLGLPPQRLEELLERGAVLPNLALPVRAPVSGRVTRLTAAVGKVVEPAEPLAEIIDLSTVWAQVEVLEADLARVRPGQEVELHLVAYPGEVIRTRLTAVGVHLDPETHVNAAWAELANPTAGEPKFLPGMAGRAYLVLPTEKPRPTVPESAVIRQGAEWFVLVEAADTEQGVEYHKEPVVPGRRSDGRVELLAGKVGRGEAVVTRGAELLGDLFAPQVLRLSPEAARTIGLTVEPVQKRAVEEIITLDGLVEVPPEQRGIASVPLNGVLHSVRVDRGQRVKPGELLAEVFSLDLQTMQLDLLRAHLEHRLAADELTRLRGVESAPRQQVWELEARAAGQRTQVETLRRKLMAAGLTPEQLAGLVDRFELVPALPVRAPLGGEVVTFEKVLGEAVAAHEPLFEIHDREQIWVRGLVAERDVGQVRTGQSVRVRFVANPTFVGTGRVVRRGGAFGTTGRDLSVWVDLDEAPAPSLRHNQLAGLTVVLGRRPPALAIPRSAVVSDGGIAFAFVRRPDGIFERRTVELGPADDRYVTITRGLTEGESVAVTGVTELMTAYAALR